MELPFLVLQKDWIDINTKDYISDREKKEINVNTYLLTSRQVGLLKYHSLSRSTQHVTFEQKRFDKSL